MRTLITLLLLISLTTPLSASEPFVIRVIDQDTGRGVPLVALRTVNSILQYTDSAGIAVFNEPGLMSSRVFFSIESHGYTFPTDKYGKQGKALPITPGGQATIKIKRTYPAERLYRITGAGIYRDSLIAGLNTPTQKPVLNARVLGSDTVITALFNNKLYWFWGDTNRPGHPLGNFQVPGATTLPPTDPNFDPDIAINLNYFTNPETGFAKKTAHMPGQGPTWIGALTVFNQKQSQRMFAMYIKVAPGMRVYEHGLVEFNTTNNQFDHYKTFDENKPVYPRGHPLTYHTNNQDYLYFTESYPLDRVPANLKAFENLDNYQSFTPLKQDSTIQDPQLDRTPNGQLNYAWKSNTPALGPALQAKLINTNKMTADEALLQLRDIHSSNPVAIHRSSVYFNNYRKRWILVGNQHYGATSTLGEMWYAEADTPIGPWVYAQQIATHNKYSFYNPKQHPYFAKQGGRVIYFEGTYTTLFSGNPVKTPRYDYNQIMHRLNLDDPRLILPLALYRSPNNKLAFSPSNSTPLRSDNIAFFAHDRQAPNDIPIYLNAKNSLSTKPTPNASILFFAHPLKNNSPKDDSPQQTTPLYEYKNSTGHARYSTNPDSPNSDYKRTRTLCRVWPNPYKASIQFKP